MSTFPGSSATRALIRFPQMNGASCSLTSPHFCFNIILFGFPVKVNNSVSMCLNRQEERGRKDSEQRTMSDVSGSFCPIEEMEGFLSFQRLSACAWRIRKVAKQDGNSDLSDNKKWTSLCFPDRAGRNVQWISYHWFRGRCSIALICLMASIG